MAKVIKLGEGKYFAPAEQTTARQDGWIIGQCGDAGITKFIGKTMDESTMVDLVVQLYRSGKREHILAGLLVEQGEKWSPESAERNADYFANLTDREAKAALSEALIPLLGDFFLNGLGLSTGSPSASSPTAADTPSAPTPRSRAKRSTKPTAPAPAASGEASPAS